MKKSVTKEQVKQFGVVLAKLQKASMAMLFAEVEFVEFLEMADLFRLNPAYTKLMEYTPESFLKECGITIQDTGESHE